MSVISTFVVFANKELVNSANNTVVCAENEKIIGISSLCLLELGEQIEKFCAQNHLEVKNRGRLFRIEVEAPEQMGKE